MSADTPLQSPLGAEIDDYAVNPSVFQMKHSERLRNVKMFRNDLSSGQERLPPKPDDWVLRPRHAGPLFFRALICSQSSLSGNHEEVTIARRSKQLANKVSRTDEIFTRVRETNETTK